MTFTTFLKLTSVSKNFGPKEVLKQISLSLNEQEMLTILGENGVGKSVLLSLIAGIDCPDDGKVEISLNQSSPFLEPFYHSSLRDSIGIQSDILALYPILSVSENLEYFCLLRGSSKTRAKELIEQFRLESVAHSLVKNISLGYLRRLNLALTMINNIKLLLLDEASNALDPKEYQFYLDFIKKNRGKMAIVMVSHRLDEAMELGGRAIILKDKVIVDDFEIDSKLKERYLRHHQ